MALKHGEPLSRVDCVHGDGAAVGNKHELRAAATGHGELQPFPAVVAHLPVVHPQGQIRATHCQSLSYNGSKNEGTRSSFSLTFYKEGL